MAVTFPNSPTLGEEYTAENGLIYIWDGEKWKTQGSYAGDQGLYILKDGSNTTLYADDTRVGIGTTSPSKNLHVYGTSGILVEDPSEASASPEIEVIGKRSDANNSPSFSGKLLLAGNNTSTSVTDGKCVGTVLFGGNHTDGTKSNILYTASVGGVAEGDYADATTMPTGLSFYTGSTGRTSSTPNVRFGTERMRITSGGFVGVGTSSPDTAIHISGTGVSDSRLMVTRSGVSGVVGIVNNDVILSGVGTNGTNGGIQFYSGGTSRSKLHPDGRFAFYNPNNNPGLGSNSIGSQFTGGILVINTESSGNVLGRNNNGAVLFFQRNGVSVGNISITGSATTYNTSSDYRLKENVVAISDASERVMALNPCRFNFISEPDTTVDGFLAHEAQEVVPESVTGTKDAVDEKGNPDYQGIDQSKLVPLLTAALQEALTKIEDLEARLSQLEGN